MRSSDIRASTVREVARLTRICLSRITDGVSLLVQAGLSAGAAGQAVYDVDLASQQRSILAKMAKETLLLAYGYDPVKSRERLNGRRSKFMQNHNVLVMGAEAQGKYPEVNMTTNVCIIRRLGVQETVGDLLSCRTCIEAHCAWGCRVRHKSGEGHVFTSKELF